MQVTAQPPQHRRLLNGFGHSVDSVFLGGLIAARRANRTIQDAIAAHTAEYGSDDAAKSTATQLDLPQLQKYFDNENARRKGIEEKAKTNLLGITLAFSVLFAGLTAAQAKGSGEFAARLGTLAIIVLGLGVAFLIVGGLHAHAAMQLGQVFTPSPEDEALDTQEEFKERVLWSLKQNERLTMLRSNALHVSFRAIRNGVVMLALLVVTLSVRGARSPTDSKATQQTVVVCMQQQANIPRAALVDCSLASNWWPTFGSLWQRPIEGSGASKQLAARNSGVTRKPAAGRKPAKK